MLVDAQGLLSDAQAITVDAASTNTFDTLVAARDMGDGEPLGVWFTVDVAADTADGDETYEFQIIQSANANLSSPDILIKTDTTFISRTVLTAGYNFIVPIPQGIKSKRYLGVYYNVGGTTPTITVTAHIAPLNMLPRVKAYANNYTIS